MRTKQADHIWGMSFNATSFRILKTQSSVRTHETIVTQTNLSRYVIGIQSEAESVFENHLGRKQDRGAQWWQLLRNLQSGGHSTDTSRMTQRVKFPFIWTPLVVLMQSPPNRHASESVCDSWVLPEAYPSPSTYLTSESQGPHSPGNVLSKGFTWTLYLT